MLKMKDMKLLSAALLILVACGTPTGGDDCRVDEKGQTLAIETPGIPGSALVCLCEGTRENGKLVYHDCWWQCYGKGCPLDSRKP